jgi:hypothetical protein
MATLAFRPRSAPELVDAAFQILRAHYAPFVMCSAIAYLPWLLFQLVLVSNPAAIEEVSLGTTILVGLGVWLTFALMSAVVIVCASQAYLGEPLDVGAAVRTAAPRLPRVLVAAFLRYLCLFLGFLALLVGALYVVARLFALTPAIVLENRSVPGAFARSSQLSAGRKRHILGTLALVVIIYWVLALGMMLLGRLTGSGIVQLVVTALYTILVYPVIAITEALLYYDARIQSEGLDIELMAGALDDAPRTTPAA